MKLMWFHLKLFADKVMPQIRDLWDDEREDHGWVKPLAGPQRAAKEAAA